MAIKSFFYFSLFIYLTKGRVFDETLSEGRSLDETQSEARSVDVFDTFKSSNRTEDRQGRALGRNPIIISTSEYNQVKGYATKLGVYDYNAKTGVYQQRSIHFKKKPRYLSQSKKSNKWFVGSTPRNGRGWLYNPATSSSVPTEGWQYNKEGEGFVSDNSIIAAEGDMKPCPAVCIYNIVWSCCRQTNK